MAGDRTRTTAAGARRRGTFFLHAHHHARFRDAHGCLVDEQHVHPLGAIRDGARSLNVDQKLSPTSEILAGEARVADFFLYPEPV